MKNQNPSANSSETGVETANVLNPRQRKLRGAALVAVLALIVLMGALVTIFLVRTAVERSASASYDAASGTRLLADTTINLVQATVNEATSGTSGLAWASQPGAIRTFNDAGSLTRIYRLYSGTEIATSTSNAAVLANDVPPGNWANDRALWVDLNKPVTVSGVSGSNYLVYPILDPRDPNNPAELLSGTNSNGTPKLDGFSISTASVPGATATQPVPMPVRWLYVLRDGRIVTPTASSPNNVSVAGATANNPITGRIAFWGDDETAKVNVNTAAGSFSEWSGTTMPAIWDTPRFRIWTERMLFSENQPVKGEYQRYPGHPATTDISAIFKSLGIPLPNTPATPPSGPTTSPQLSPETSTSPLFSYLPRYTDSNSSKGGTFNTTRISTPPVINSGVAKSDRLFTSIGESLFTPSRASSGLNRQQMESGKFFLTSHSRSPETTLFGTPRIAMWPINKDSGATKRTTFDNLLAFCATTGTGNQAKPYYVQRGNAYSTTEDGSIQRNRDLYGYLQNLTNRQIPGFGGSFASKYSHASGGATERDQILGEILDYIRSTNVWDHSVPASNTSFSRFTSSPPGVSGYGFQGVVNPMTIAGSSVSGMGRAQTLSEIGIVFICTADGNSPRGAYQTPVNVAGVRVSPVVGSATDALYASNLPEAQFLRNDANNIVGWDSTARTVITGTSPTTPPTGAGPFPSNPTLTSNGQFGGTLVALAPGQKKIQAMLLFELASPMMGYDAMQLNVRPALKINVSGIENIVISQPSPAVDQRPFPARVSTGTTAAPNTNGNGLLEDFPTRTGAEQGTGGILGFRYTLRGRFNTWSGQPWPSSSTSSRPYRYVSDPFTVSTVVTGSVPALTLGGGFTAELQTPTTSGASTYQRFNVEFPSVNNVPLPDLMKTGLTKGSASVAGEMQDIAADWWGFDLRIRQASSATSLHSKNVASPLARWGTVIRSDVSGTTTMPGNWRYDLTGAVQQPSYQSQGSGQFGGWDVVRTLVARDGDYRLVAAQGSVTANGASSSPFAKGPGYDSGIKMGNIFRDHYSSFATAGTDIGGKLVNNAPYGQNFTPKVPSTVTSAKQTWDWDNGLPWESDGAYGNKADEGNIYVSSASPYYNREQAGTGSDTITSYFTANRIISSAGMLGSLPTGVLEGVSWRTLLFRPQIDRPQDPVGPKDHLMLDFFNMPVVEPYAISEPFSTDGKVNMNYQIVPFTYINRSSGVRAVLSTEMVTRVPRAAAGNQSGTLEHPIYKPTGSTNNGPSATAATAGGVTLARMPLNLSETNGSLRQFQEKFAAWDIFRSPSEICDIYLVPQGYNWSSNAIADAAWYGDDFALVGDNVRERPYANLYPRLTTKSNTFTVHYTVQTLKNPPSADPTLWNESRGQVTGELRGSTTLERFLDPADGKIPDYGTSPNSDSLDKFYQWRVISNSTFAP